MDTVGVELVVDDKVAVTTVVTDEVEVTVVVKEATDALESADLEFVGVAVWEDDVVTVVEADAELQVDAVPVKVLIADKVLDAE
jgi:hypothetical protein